MVAGSRPAVTARFFHEPEKDNMTTKTMKVPRGTARRLRRAGVSQGLPMLPAAERKQSVRALIRKAWRVAAAIANK
jgi:hypothetical protein